MFRRRKHARDEHERGADSLPSGDIPSNAAEQQESTNEAWLDRIKRKPKERTR